MSEPTPRPWKLRGHNGGGDDQIQWIEDANGADVTEPRSIQSGEELANLELIVRAVNAHAALVRALEAAQWHASEGAGRQWCYVCGQERAQGHEVGCFVGLALALAKPSTSPLPFVPGEAP